MQQSCLYDEQCGGMMRVGAEDWTEVTVVLREVDGGFMFDAGDDAVPERAPYQWWILSEKWMED
ncbi:hypothetical protein BGAL_0223g00110 [Botrytis galanthina]|uniref:Uncharacterized protein n=1 Tax=Botrytis galanthina TaxID=278940 RepID=A0A4S8R403_9HELO|nr:hypothetical protein BGAL_0223g00110 [Botrytis galanthina]